VAESRGGAAYESTALWRDPSRAGPARPSLDPTDDMAAYGAGQAALIHCTPLRPDTKLHLIPPQWTTSADVPNIGGN
jgi:hypothetical protein